MNDPHRPTGTHRTRRAGARRRRSAAGIGAIIALAVFTGFTAGCAHFPDSAPTFTNQPSLQPNVATPITPTPAGGSSGTRAPSPPSGPPSSTAPGASATPDPCAPSQPPVIATCLHAPWGLAPLPDGASALVGERTTGKILRVAAGKEPEVVATVTGLDTSGGGGLLGIALSPYYAEDDLIYAYVSTPTDNRIVRIAAGEQPKAIFTGIPHGNEHNGGPIAFGADNLLYVATGDAGDPEDRGDPSSLAGKVLRLDALGRPAGTASVTGTAPATGRSRTTGTAPTSGGATPTTGTAPTTSPTTGTTVTSSTRTSAGGNPAVYASGFTDPTGICPLPGGQVGIVDHRGTGDLLIPARHGGNYTSPRSGDTLWVYQAGDGGGVDCAVSAGYLLATSLDAQKVTSIQMTPAGGFTGSPEDLAVKTFGRLRTVITGPGDLIWLTTANKDGHGRPVPSDDRVIVLPPQSGGGGGGGVD